MNTTPTCLTKKYSWLLLLACACAWASSMGCATAPGSGGASEEDPATGAPHGAAGAPAGGAAPQANGGAAAAACGVVQTAQGPVMGKASTEGCVYLGIPYAAPPIGALRWKPPQPAAAWTTPRPSVAGSACPQTKAEMGEASTNEDCLYLNVWIPAGPAQPKRPVMVFVYGGGFMYGSGTVPLYDGTKLANATGAIVVTLNYRLGAFGFFSIPELRAEDPAHPSAGNYGIEDQNAAFQWVKKNVAEFGGDPSNVTIFGESAGGTSVLTHLASPKSAGLFARAIVESAWAMAGHTTFTPATADKGGAQLARALDCTDDATLLPCLRGKSAADILQAMTNMGGPFTGGVTFSPVVDGFVLPDDPVKVFEKGTFNKVPTMIGTNKNEARLFFYMSGSGMDIPAPIDPLTYLAFAELLYPGKGLSIVDQYPTSSFQGSYKAAVSEAMTDFAFVCGARSVARALAAAGVPTFRYDFTRVLDVGVPDLGAFHASELPYVFANPMQPQAPLTPSDLSVAKRVMAYWGSMATHGDPNVAGEPAWPRYDTTNETQIILDLTVATESLYKKAKCDFWDSLAN